MGEASEPVGSVEVALAHATRLLASNPVLAAERRLGLGLGRGIGAHGAEERNKGEKCERCESHSIPR